jgi:UDP-N-acetyl-D-mannosaminuronic acid dehydrogenase
MLALGGHEVSGFDVNVRLRESLRSGGDHIGETEVRELVRSALLGGRLVIADVLEPADSYIICVPTPNAPDGRPDLKFVHQASTSIASLIKSGDLVILESTVPPGTVERVVASALRDAGVDLDEVHLAHCPERVIPGAIVRELKYNSRIVGGRRPEDAQAARALYESFVEAEIAITDSTTAELVKVVENTFRDVNIALANELALLCEELHVDVWEAIRLANMHPRVNILNPGPGVGGHCIPIDPHFLADANPFLTELIQTARRVNARMPNHVVRRVREMVAAPPEESKIALLGASYKANVDDSRESPTEKIDELLRELGYATSIYDPVASGFSRPLSKTLEETLDGADALVLVVDHDAFRGLNPALAAKHMRGRSVIDARNFLPETAWAEFGFRVRVLGKGRRAPAAGAVVNGASGTRPKAGQRT